MTPMPRRIPLLALPLGFLAALAVAACGSGGSQDSAVTTPPLPATTQASVPATIATTTAATATQTTVPTTTTTATTPTSTRPSGGAPPTSQATGGAPAGCPSAVGNFIRDVRATDCGVAGTVANAWFAAVHGGARPDGPIQAAGYSCTGTMAGEQASVSCTGSGGSVAFTASP